MSRKFLNPFDSSVLTFITLAQNRSFIGTAKSLGRTQSAVSKAIDRLEKQLEMTLVDRTTRPVRLTSEGVYFYEEFSNYANLMQESVRRLKESNMVKPILKVGVVESMTADIAPDLTEQLLKRTSSLTVLSGSSDVLLSHLLQRRLDIVLVSSEFSEEKQIERYYLFSEPSVLLLPNSLPHKASWSWKDLHFCGLPIISASPSLGGGRLNSQYFSRIHESFPSRLFVDLNCLMVEMIKRGQGWALSRPSTMVQTKTSPDVLQIVPMPPPCMSREIYLLVRKGELKEEARKIQNIIREQLLKNFFPLLLKIAPWIEKELIIVTEDGKERISFFDHLRNSEKKKS